MSEKNTYEYEFDNTYMCFKIDENTNNLYLIRILPDFSNLKIFCLLVRKAYEELKTKFDKIYFITYKESFSDFANFKWKLNNNNNNIIVLECDINDILIAIPGIYKI